MLEIKKTTMSEIECNPGMSALLGEYGDELSVDGLPHPSAKIDTYKNLEKMGVGHTIGAYLEGTIIGIINLLLVPNPHYGVAIATTESFFVRKDYRKTGAGLKLLREAEKYASKVKSPGLLVSAPSGGTLSLILPNLGYNEISKAYFKELSPCIN